MRQFPDGKREKRGVLSRYFLSQARNQFSAFRVFFETRSARACSHRQRLATAQLPNPVEVAISVLLLYRYNPRNVSIRLCRRSLELDPVDHVNARRGLVRLLLDAGEADKARAVIDR